MSTRFLRLSVRFQCARFPRTRFPRTSLVILLVSLLVAGCTHKSSDPGDPVVPGASANKKSHPAPSESDSDALVEYAAVTTSPGIGTYILTDRKLEGESGSYHYGSKQCHWCIAETHRESDSEPRCDGSIYFGVRTDTAEYVYLPPRVTLECGCHCQRN